MPNSLYSGLGKKKAPPASQRVLLVTSTVQLLSRLLLLVPACRIGYTQQRSAGHAYMQQAGQGGMGNMQHMGAGRRPVYNTLATLAAGGCMSGLLHRMVPNSVRCFWVKSRFVCGGVHAALLLVN